MPVSSTAEPWRAVHRAADSHVARFTSPFVSSVKALRRRVSLPMLEESVRAGTPTRELIEAIDRVRVAKIAADPADLATKVYAETIVESVVGQAAYVESVFGTRGAAIVGRFNIVSPFVLRAAEELGANLIREVGDETKAAVRRVIFNATRDGVAPRDAAKQIKDIIGLTTRQALAVNRLEAGLLEQGADAGFARARGRRYSEQLLKDRAENIARTETMRASNRGQQLLWSEMADAGVIGQDFGQRWLVTPDDRLCPRCAPMQGKVVQLGYLFRETENGVLPSTRRPAVRGASVESPPLHPRCRCTLVFDDDIDRLPEVAPPAQPSTEVVVPKPKPSTVVTPTQPARPPAARPAAAVPDDVYDALMPKRGGWTTQTRKKTIDAIKQAWPGGDGRILAETLSGFQRNGSIPRLRTAIMDHLTGKGNERGRVVVTALRGVDPSRVPNVLHRGMVVKGTPQEVLERHFSAGHRFDHNISSYSTDSKLAQSFADPKASTVKVDGARVVMRLEGDTKALPIENLAPTNVFAGEKEWVTAGRFEVVDSKVTRKKLYRWEKNKWVATGETEEFVEVSIRQVAL